MRGWRSLTEALAARVEDATPPGILLSARTGAGKTLATIKAFRDCVRKFGVRKRTHFCHRRSRRESPARLRVEAAKGSVLEGIGEAVGT